MNLKELSPRVWIAVSFLLLMFVLGACSSSYKGVAGGAQTAQAAPEQTITPIGNGFTVEGNIVPLHSAELGFTSGGKIAEVLAKEGDQVEAGQILARLEDHAQTEAAIAAAELQVAQSQQTLDELMESADTAYGTALQTVAAEAKAVREAQYQLDNYSVPSNFDKLTPETALPAAQQAYLAARQEFDACKDSSRSSECDDLEDTLDSATSDYNTAVRWLQLETDLKTARIDYERALQDAASLQEGPDADALRSAEAALKSAQAELAAAQARHDSSELKAPIDGVISNLGAMAGEQAAPNQPVITVADFSQWMVETDNLTELDVVNIQPGQKVIVIADALPEMQLTGTVESIASQFEEKRGDITYTAKIVLQDTQAPLRWGMTVAVSFE